MFWSESVDKEIEKLGAIFGIINNEAKNIYKKIIRPVSILKDLVFHTFLVEPTVYFQQCGKFGQSNNCHP